jgi:AraC-like DNA-binding protein
MEGEMIRSLAGREFIMAPQDVLLIPPGLEHSWRILPGHLCHRISIHFREDLLDDTERFILPEVFDPAGLCLSGASPHTDEVFARSLLDCLNLDGQTQKLAFRSRILSLLTGVFSLREQEEPPPPRKGSGGRLLGAVLEYISGNLPKPLSLAGLARRFSISKNYLNLLFRAETGITVNRYIQEQRLSAARRELEAGKGAEETAYALGFNEYSTFYRAYKARFGNSPIRSNHPLFRDPRIPDPGSPGGG